MSDFGLLSTGFQPMQLQDVLTQMQQSLSAAFGQNLDFLPESIFGQITGIYAEREALIWQLAEAIYASQYPEGAEGTSVDNILALNNLRRLGATPSVTPPTDTSGTPGLVLYGTPGTIVPAGSLISIPGSPSTQFAIDATVTIGSAVNDVQSIFFSNVPTQGAFELSIVDPAGNLLTTASMALITQNTFTYSPLAANTQLLLSTPFTTSGTFKITVTQAGVPLTTGAITVNATPATTAAAIQTALRALSGYSGVTVSVGAESASGYSYVINWGAIVAPVMSTNTNSTVATLTVMGSIQSHINNLPDSVASTYPYADAAVTVTGSFTTGFIVTFGGIAGDQAQSLMSVAANTLQNGSSVTNINVVQTTPGNPAQVIASATATVDGPIFAPAGTLTVIASPVSGWSSVNNPLDAIPGTNIETDAEALTRRNELLAEQANGPIQSIVEKVQSVAGVSQAIGFENLTNAAVQVITFGSVPVTGAFQILIGPSLTASIAYTASSATVQTAVQALSGLGSALVTGNFSTGFSIDFNGSLGGQPQPLVVVQNNTLGVSTVVAYGRPAHSFEIVVEGGENAAIAQAIYGSKPGGIQSYGNVTIDVEDAFGNLYPISFSRPTQVPIYVAIVLVTDLTTNPNPKFNVGSIPTIQEDIVAIGSAIPIGGLIIGFGTNGLIGAFNSVPGINSYTLFFGESPGPGSNANIQLQPEQIAEFETFNISVSFS